MLVRPFSPETLNDALSIIRAGGVIAHATETCYGFACDIGNPAAVATLFAIKQRPVGQPVSALFSSIDEAKKYVEWNEKAEELARQYLPGPLTLILPVREDAPKKLFPIINYQLSITLGIRVSSHPHAKALIESFASPLTTTSANLHGQPNPYSAEDILKQFEHQTNLPDLILDSGTLPATPPSTVIDLTNGGLARRQGDVRI